MFSCASYVEIASHRESIAHPSKHLRDICDIPPSLAKGSAIVLHDYLPIRGFYFESEGPAKARATDNGRYEEGYKNNPRILGV